ncbi:BON domain-containing protein [Exilibacterium tricleocarpae]|uniref:BON domain-containing protein n=1 Tax=Exilibacterium tricleocarpae TaxID=2591008 RepID=A0A545TSK3_9GAMM|nr:BON domain-containing protein [Exilibacterium tricleocarpae]TQV80200.1 BON domain-containing protein [Exilibacterium tricleocarpae]
MTRTLLTWGIITTCLLGSGCVSVINATSKDPIKPDPGKRTFGTMIDDQRLETIAAVNIKKAHPALNNAHINVTSYNGVLLLTGQVKSAELRTLASETAAKIPKVRQVYNELQVQGKLSILARTNDSWLTTKVKTKLMAHRDISSNRIKVVTENGTVFLMGLLSHAEADRAAEVARTTGGVQKVVKAIEYLN